MTTLMQQHFCVFATPNDLVICSKMDCPMSKQISCPYCFNNHNKDHEAIQLLRSPFSISLMRLLSADQLLHAQLNRVSGRFGAYNEAYIGPLSRLLQDITTNTNFIEAYLQVRPLLQFSMGVTVQPLQVNFIVELCKYNERKFIQHVRELQNPVGIEQINEYHFDFHLGYSYQHFQKFIAEEQQLIQNYIEECLLTQKPMKILPYLEQRPKISPTHPQHYSRYFEAFLSQYYAINPAAKPLFTTNAYSTFAWGRFGTFMSEVPENKAFIDEEIQFFLEYVREAFGASLRPNMFNYKLWRKGNRPEWKLTSLGNPYFLLRFVEETQLFLLENELYYRQNLAEFTWKEFTTYLKDFVETACPYGQATISYYRDYYRFRKSQQCQQFLNKIGSDLTTKSSEKLAIAYLGDTFANNKSIGMPQWGSFAKNWQSEQDANVKKQQEQFDQLIKELQADETNIFYLRLFLDYWEITLEQGIDRSAAGYKKFRELILNKFNEDYIKTTNEEYLETIKGLAQEPSIKLLKPYSDKINALESGLVAELNEGRNYDSEEQNDDYLEDQELRGLDKEDIEEIKKCPCCKGHPYRCKQPQCEVMGSCVVCMFGNMDV